MFQRTLRLLQLGDLLAPLRHLCEILEKFVTLNLLYAFFFYNAPPVVSYVVISHHLEGLN